MPPFNQGDLYKRSDVWRGYRGDSAFPRGGPWLTGYVREADTLIAFANINSPGRTGHDFPNSYDEDTGKLVWFGKPNAHSAQDTFKSLFEGRLRLIVFARWDSACPLFTFLGPAQITSFDDWVELADGTKTIRIIASIIDAQGVIAPLPSSMRGRHQPPHMESRRVEVNRYERNPALRAACIAHLGDRCRICGFSFEETYGPIGRGFCHVHHITPLSEVGGEGDIDPRTDLIPVCPNCHAMLHRKSPALKPEDIRVLLSDQIQKTS